MALLPAAAIAALLSAGQTSGPGACAASLSPSDRAAIEATIQKYRTAWLAGDAEGVMSTLTGEAVLLPPQGAKPVVGAGAIRAWWWPPGAPPTTVTRLDITIEETGGDCQVGHVRGRDEVRWLGAGGKERGNSGTYLNVMKKQPDGRWLISHHMWDDDPSARR